MELPKKLTKKKLIAGAIVLVCLLIGVDVTMLEQSNVKSALDKAQSIVGGLLGEEAPVEAAPVTSETGE